MPKNSSIAQAKYDATHCRTYGLKFNLGTDADIIEKLSSVPSMQGYIKQLIRNDITCTCSVPVPENTMAMLQEEADKNSMSAPALVNLIVNGWLLHNSSK